jgi:hypothetical protein
LLKEDGNLKVSATKIITSDRIVGLYVSGSGILPIENLNYNSRTNLSTPTSLLFYL